MPRLAAGRRFDDDLHGFSGLAAHDSADVQNRRRIPAGRIPHCRPYGQRSRSFYFRRSLRRHGLPFHRLRHDHVFVAAGSHGFGRRIALSGNRRTLCLHARVRRLPYISRNAAYRSAGLRRIEKARRLRSAERLPQKRLES